MENRMILRGIVFNENSPKMDQRHHKYVFVHDDHPGALKLWNSRWWIQWNGVSTRRYERPIDAVDDFLRRVQCT
jgi:hypothetical protein